MLELVANAAAVLTLILAVGYLTIRAKRFDFEKFRTVHSRRKYRVPVAQARADLSTGEGNKTSEKTAE